MIFFWLEVIFTDFAENLHAGKKIQIKGWYMILGTDILSYEEFHCKTMQISEESEL